MYSMEGGRGRVVPIQFMEGDTLVTKPVEVATLHNDYCVNITRGISLASQLHTKLQK